MKMITRQSNRSLLDIYEYYILMLNLKYFSPERLSTFPPSNFDVGTSLTIYNERRPAREIEIFYHSIRTLYTVNSFIDDFREMFEYEFIFAPVSLFGENYYNDVNSENDNYLQYLKNYRPFLDDDYACEEDRNKITQKIRDLYLEYVKFVEYEDNVFPEMFIDDENICEPTEKNTCNICLSENAYINCGRDKCTFSYCPECFISGTCITTMCCGCRYEINPDEIIIDFEFKKLKKKRNYFKFRKHKRRR